MNPITFELALALKPEDIVYQHTGWKDGATVSFMEWRVRLVGPKSITLYCPSSRWGRDVRFCRRHFPLQFWSTEK